MSVNNNLLPRKNYQKSSTLVGRKWESFYVPKSTTFCLVKNSNFCVRVKCIESLHVKYIRTIFSVSQYALFIYDPIRTQQCDSYRNKSVFVIKIWLSYKLLVCQQITEKFRSETTNNFRSNIKFCERRSVAVDEMIMRFILQIFIVFNVPFSMLCLQMW